MKDYEILQKADRDIEFAQSYINYAKNSQDTHYKMAVTYIPVKANKM